MFQVHALGAVLVVLAERDGGGRPVGMPAGRAALPGRPRLRHGPRPHLRHSLLRLQPRIGVQATAAPRFEFTRELTDEHIDK